MLNDYGMNKVIPNRKNVKSPMPNSMNIINIEEMKKYKLKYQ